jgi:hypothetical protein
VDAFIYLTPILSDFGGIVAKKSNNTAKIVSVLFVSQGLADLVRVFLL